MARGTPQYLAEYNSYTIPGFVQSESFDSTASIVSHDAPYADGGLLENTGIQNKVLSLRMKVWDESYAACKNQIEQAATILRSKRNGYGILKIMYTDRHYEVIPRSIRMDKSIGSTVKTADYDIEFSSRPWLFSDTASSYYSGTLTEPTYLTTTSGRTLDNGGWTPTTYIITGSNITLSGWSEETGECTGYITISGIVTNLIIDSEAFTATASGTLLNMNSYMTTPDYRLMVGPGENRLFISGASSFDMSWTDRWYL